MHGKNIINDIEESYCEDVKLTISVPDTKELKHKTVDDSVVINSKHIYDNNGNIVIAKSRKKKNRIRKGNW